MADDSQDEEDFSSIGFKLIVVSFIVGLIYSTSFTESLVETFKYEQDVCHVNSIEITYVNVDCIDGTITVVSMPCVLIYVDTERYKNISFYRSYDEKAYIIEKNATCSYLPMTCGNDPAFTYKALVKNLPGAFPSENSIFKCFTLPNNSNTNINDVDALLYVTDQQGFFISITVLASGFLFGLSFFMYRWIYQNNIPSKKLAYKRFIRCMESLDNDKGIVQLMLNRNGQFLNDADIAGESDSNEKALGIFSDGYSNNLTLSENVDRGGKKEAKILQDLGYKTGRVGYASSTKSSCSVSITSKRVSMSSSKLHTDDDDRLSINSNNIDFNRKKPRISPFATSNKKRESIETKCFESEKE